MSIIKQHLCTYVMLSEGKSIGYGHLEEENDMVWLGIAMIESHTGLGLGKIMMKKLLDFAYQKDKKTIHLSVDKENKGAIYLYQKFGFKIIKEMNSNVLLLRYTND